LAAKVATFPDRIVCTMVPVFVDKLADIKVLSRCCLCARSRCSRSSQLHVRP
jgi:hypothetical protein